MTVVVKSNLSVAKINPPLRICWRSMAQQMHQKGGDGVSCWALAGKGRGACEAADGVSFPLLFLTSFGPRQPAPLAGVGARPAPSLAARPEPRRARPGPALLACAGAGGRWVLGRPVGAGSQRPLSQRCPAPAGRPRSAQPAPRRPRPAGLRGLRRSPPGPSSHINPTHLHNGFYEIKTEEAFFSFLLKREENR